MKDEKIDRLLRSAAQADDQTEAAMPFGFDTRVVALWRAGCPRRMVWCGSSGAWLCCPWR